MPDWDERNNKHVLIVYRQGNNKYKLSGMIRITTPQGDEYMTGLPENPYDLMGMIFEDIEFTSPQGTDVADTASLLALNHYNPDANIGTVST